MPVSKKLKSYLDENDIKYLTISHSRAFTAQEIAASIHCPGKELAKSVIVKADEEYVMVVLPASEKIDFSLLREKIKAEELELSTEEEFKGLFPECEVGAMPIFGNLYDLAVYVSEDLLEDEDIYFNAGNHTLAIKMKTEDFVQLVKPTALKIALQYHY